MGVTIGDHYQMRQLDEMHVEARLAFALMKGHSEVLPEGITVQITGTSSHGATAMTHVKQTVDSKAYGRVYSYPEMLFVAWFKKVRGRKRMY